MSGLADWISQFGTAVGTFGGAASSYVLKRFLAAEKDAAAAKTAANDALKYAKEAVRSITALQQGLRLELTAFKTDILERASRGSRPDAGDARLLADLHHKVEELRGEMLRERGQRHALQREIQEDAREDAKQWTELNRELAILTTKVEILMDSRR